MAYVPLERTFLPFEASREMEPEVAAYFAWEDSFQTNSLSWTDLMQSRLVIVLGEAGVGKTTEFKAQAERLNKAGRIAFFLRIENLGASPLSDAFEPYEDIERFEHWLAQELEAYFFLDAVDEARLHQPNMLNTALRQLRRDIGKHIHRARLFLSCRASDWRYLEDQEQLDQIFPKPFQAKETSSRIVQMRPLNAKQVSTLARAQGLEDTAPLIDAIEADKAQSFAQRPLDINWLVTHWKREKRLGSLRELIELNVQQKLQEENTHRRHGDQLTPNKLRTGAETLAAALVLCGKSALLLPGSARNNLDDSAMDASHALPHWKAPDIDRLLTSAVFDEATYGRVRVHHRSVREYLAARWLLEQVRSRQALLRFCTRRVGGGRVALYALKGVLGWMATIDEQLRENVISMEPMLLLGAGDPAALPEASRQRLLYQLVEHYADRKHVRLDVDGVMLRRFVSPALAPTIQRLLRANPHTDDVRELLLRMIAIGVLKECSELALDKALDARESVYVRQQAIRAVASCDYPEHCDRLLEWTRQSAPLPDPLTEEILRNLFPSRMSVERCVALLHELRSPLHTPLLSLKMPLERHLFANCPSPLLASFLQALLKFSASGDHSKRYEWLTTAITCLLIRIFNNPPAQPVPLELLKQAFAEQETRRQLHKSQSNTSGELSAALHPHRRLREQLFWFCVRSRPDLDIWSIRYSLCVDELDIPWLVEGAISEQSDQVREVALSFVQSLWSQGGRKPEQREQMLRLAERNLRVRTYLEEKTRPFPPVPPTMEFLRWAEDQRRRQEEWHHDALQKVDRIAEGAEIEILTRLVFPADEDLSRRELLRYAQARWEQLAGSFGEQLAEAGRIGCKKFWRTWIPPLPAEQSHEDESRLRVGLSGLQTELNEGLNFAQLSTEEKEIAVKYALSEPLELPEWFGDLTHKAPAVVETILTQALAAEFTTQARSPSDRSLLMKLESTSSWTRDLLVRLLQERLSLGEPHREKVLEEALRILRHAPTADRVLLATLAQQGIEHRQSMDAPGWIDWLVTWLDTDGASAWSFVEDWLQTTESTAETAHRLEQLASAIRLDAHPYIKLSATPSYHAPATLRRMLLTLYRYLPEKEERKHERDAFQLRSQLCRLLAHAPGDEAQQELLALAKKPELAAHRDYFLQLADVQARDDAHFKAWSERDFANFLQGKGQDPFRHKVFVSYRRVDHPELTDRICEGLTRKLGHDNVFKDEDSIPSGTDFDKAIKAWLADSDVLIAIIGPLWANDPRLQNPADFVRQELELAFQRQIPVVPVLIGNAPLPRAEQLPGSLQTLPRHQALNIRTGPDFARDMDKLLSVLAFA